MATNDYHITTHWQVPGTVADVYAVLSNPGEYPRWWSEVFLEVQPRVWDDPGRIPVLAEVQTRGLLPYTLRFQAFGIEADHPDGFTIGVTGDFVGRGIWRFEQAGDVVKVTFDWKLRVEKPLVRELSGLLKPLFIANHRWAMRRGEIALRKELKRRAAVKALSLAMPA